MPLVLLLFHTKYQMIIHEFLTRYIQDSGQSRDTSAVSRHFTTFTTHFRFYLFKINPRNSHERSNISCPQHATDKALSTNHMLESKLDLYLLRLNRS